MNDVFILSLKNIVCRLLIKNYKLCKESSFILKNLSWLRSKVQSGRPYPNVPENPSALAPCFALPPASRCISTIHGGHARSYNSMDGGGRETAFFSFTEIINNLIG